MYTSFSFPCVSASVHPCPVRLRFDSVIRVTRTAGNGTEGRRQAHKNIITITRSKVGPERCEWGPLFMPGPQGRPPKPAASAIVPETHQHKHMSEIKFYGPDRNATGTLTYSNCKQCYRAKVPASPGRAEQPAWYKQTHFGCSKCKVNLCSELCCQGVRSHQQLPAARAGGAICASGGGE